MPPSKSKDANPNRRNGKASKKKTGVAPGDHNGKTVDGYSPAAAARRATKRSTT